MLQLIIISTLCLNNAQSLNLNLLPYLLTNNETNLIGCVKDILHHQTSPHWMLSYRDNYPVVEEISKLSPNFKIINLKISYNPPKITDEFIMIVVKTVNDLETFLTSLHFNSKSFVEYLIVYLGIEKVDLIFRHLWKHYIMNVLVVDLMNRLHTYRPYKDGCENIPPIFLGDCSWIGIQEVVDEVYEIRTQTLFGCRVKALAMINPPYVIRQGIVRGFEVDLFKLVGEMLNFTLELRPYDYIEKNFNDSARVFFKESLDLFFGRLMLHDGFKSFYDVSVPYCSGQLAFYVPAAQPISNWRNLIKIFHPKIWFLTLLSIIFINLAVFLAKPKIFTNLNTFAVLFQQGVNTPHTKILKYLFTIWLFFSLIITNTFNSAFASFVAKPAREYQIETVTEIFQEKMNIGCHQQVREIFQEIHKIHRLIDCPINGSCLFRTGAKRDLASIENTVLANYFINELRDISGRSKVYRLKYPIHYFHIGAMFRKKHPIGKMVNSLLLKFQDFGFILRLQGIYENREMEAADEFGVVTLEHFLIPFCLHLFGILAGSVSFIWELQTNKNNNI